ncbi:unnamed protein product [Acanthoscelides obtectus]|uniref:PiggyBac transposable element-derived protein domain-containing protein n=1 Tax=Acanthoscelides obtectus TaxID=200917 RepID=A0A9P0PZN2_ACAOB|nr:unnamed protein product [Acanthoscelides obtectus]CAK1651405.1 PiggyBac transposable element-derived protein 4 [Acanthoscelides obtectus]
MEDFSVEKKRFYIGKNKFKWHKDQPPVNVRTRKHNIVLTLTGLRPKAKQLGANPEIEDILLLLFSEDMIAEVIQWTNVKIIDARKKYKDQASPILSTTTAVFKSENESIESLFAIDGTGRDVFRCTTAKRRFEFLLTVLRFDDATLRNERQIEGDPVPHISKIFNKFIDNSQNAFSIGTNATVDEMLVAFRGRCKFKIYMPKKPARYGIKIMCLTDARNNYLYNAYIYAGKGLDSLTLSANERKLKIPTQSVIRLVGPIKKTNRNVAADNWFSSVELVQHLQNRGLTYVGALKKNQAAIPPSFQANKNRRLNSSLYGYNNDMTLLSFVPKSSKSVILISSMHHGESTDQETGKPEIIAYYNSTKGGVDSLDKKSVNYSPSRRTQRWPTAIFFMLVDVSTINAYVLCSSYKHTPKLERADFLKKLARSLVLPQWRVRIANSKLPRELRVTIESLCGSTDYSAHSSDVLEDRLEKRATCYRCPPKLKRKTQYGCASCKKPICLQCSKKLCIECVLDRK